MIAVDSSSLIAFLEGAQGPDVEAVEAALRSKQVVLPPVVVTELLSDPKLPKPVMTLLRGIPRLAMDEGYWERAGLLRARVLAKGQKARLAGSLIAQSCLDHRVALITRDSDFRHYVKVAGLQIFH